MPVDTARAEYDAKVNVWCRTRDCFNGSDAVKAAGPKYLPPLDSHKLQGVAFTNNNLPGNLDSDYQVYVQRALFYNAFRRTVEGMSGAIFAKAPAVTVPSVMKDHLQDITMGDVPFELFALLAARELLVGGRYGILVDVAETPEDTEALTAAEKEAIGRPYWAGYVTESIVSWYTEFKAGNEVTTRVVLREYKKEPDPKDPFVIKDVEQYRVLHLQEGVYHQTVYRKPENKSEWVQVSDVTPTRKGEGGELDFIPFYPMGPCVNRLEPDAPPLLDMADVLLSLYRNSADFEHGLHYTGIPILWAAGLAQDPQGQPLPLGPTKMILLEKGGQLGIEQADGDLMGALKEAMAEKRKLLATFGARLLEDQGGQAETATAIRLRYSGEHATLATIAQSLEQSLTKAAQAHGWWVGTEAKPDDVKAKVELNKDFFSTRLEPEEIKALVFALQAETISYETFFFCLGRGDMVRPGVTVEQELAAIKSNSEFFREGRGLEKEEEEQGDEGGESGGKEKGKKEPPKKEEKPAAGQES